MVIKKRFTINNIYAKTLQTEYRYLARITPLILYVLFLSILFLLFLTRSAYDCSDTGVPLDDLYG